MNDYNPYDCSVPFEKKRKQIRALIEEEKEKRWHQMLKDIDELKKRMDKIEGELCKKS
jgi:hypothetical protein